ncbi:MAG: class I SAM-dependent methyltransferase [Acidobacteria bacterium]|nr:class I SAM-dependent methyltransferase [Acidobacteriota bacterium]
MSYSFKIIDRCNMCGNTKGISILGKRLNTSQGKKPASKTGIATTIVKCKNCHLIFSNPQPIPQNLFDHYGVPPESYWQGHYFQIESDCFQHEIRTVQQIIGKTRGIVALDIGAGIGKTVVAMQRAGFEAYGIEPSVPFYEYAVNKMGICSERLILASAETAFFPDAYFDFVTFGAVLEHLYDPSQAIVRALTWLKHGGILHAEVPSSQWLVNKIANLYYRLIGTDYVANLSPMHSPFHLYEFSVDSFREHSKAHRYEVAFFEYFVCQTYLPKILDKPLRTIMNMTKTGMQLSIWLRKK